MSDIPHNENSYNCICLACWRADVADQKERKAKSPEARLEQLEAIVRELADMLGNRQWTVHCGQFHQWKSMRDCTEKNCTEANDLIRRSRQLLP
jgi:hypothetical protein